MLISKTAWTFTIRCREQAKLEVDMPVDVGRAVGVAQQGP